jgi:hypothetical protein
LPLAPLYILEHLTTTNTAIDVGGVGGVGWGGEGWGGIGWVGWGGVGWGGALFFIEKTIKRTFEKQHLVGQKKSQSASTANETNWATWASLASSVWGVTSNC